LPAGGRGRFKVAGSLPLTYGSVPLGHPAGISGYVNHRIPTRREPKMSASAPAVNAVTLVGNLTADPITKQLDENRKVCNLRIAVNDVKDQPMFIDVATFGAQADACARYLTKGRAVAVTGRLVYREWDDNGTRRSKHHVVGRVQFGGKPDSDGSDTRDAEPEEAAAL
jgi:single-strand DNA-binding protein